VSNHGVTDEVILEGFRSLHEAMAHGFDRVDRRMDSLESRMTAFEARMMRRFDKVDERLDNHERRITAIEAKI
jgi:hypothetical protein